MNRHFMGKLTKCIDWMITHAFPPWRKFCVNMFLAFFVGNMVGSLIPDSQFKDGLLMTAGFCTYPILNIIETQSRRRLGALMDRVMNKWIGPVGVDKDTPEA